MIVTRRCLLAGALVATVALAGCGTPTTARIAERCRAVPGVAMVEITDRVSFLSAAELAVTLADGLDATQAHRAIAEVCAITATENWVGALEVHRADADLLGTTDRVPRLEEVSAWWAAADRLDEPVGAAVGTGLDLRVGTADIPATVRNAAGLAAPPGTTWTFRQDDRRSLAVTAPMEDDAVRWARLSVAAARPPATTTELGWAVRSLAAGEQHDLALTLWVWLPGAPRAADVPAEPLLGSLGDQFRAADLTRAGVGRRRRTSLEIRLVDGERHEALAEWRSDGSRAPYAPLSDELAALLPLAG